MKLITKALGVALIVPAWSSAAVDYLRDIKPILTQHCVQCHGTVDTKAGFRLDTAPALREGGDSAVPPLRRRHGGESLLVKVVMGDNDVSPRMPYKKPPLDPAQIALLRAWVAEGAPAPEDEEPGVYQHWSFAQVQRPPLPSVKNGAWARHPIDAFILGRLEEEKIEPAPEADRLTLLRRVSLDLVGLPPTAAETKEYLSDERPDAYLRLVDRLLASPHHGERWGRHWLDVARYADSHGYSIDAPRQIWKYRDWVVNALNRDLPYDQFVIEQLAGDLLPDATLDQKVATGFNRNTQINGEGGVDPEQFRIESVFDRVNTFGTAFLGLTIGCAQCHDHKFDPIRQKEYYQLFAFFNNTADDGHSMGRKVGGMLTFKDEIKIDLELNRQVDAARVKLADYVRTRDGDVDKWAVTLTTEARSQLTQAMRDALETPWDKLSAAQQRAIYKSAVEGKDSEFAAREAALVKLERDLPKAPTTLVMEELPTPRETVLLQGGDFMRPGEMVSPGTPAALPPLRVATPNRLDLARWTVDPANPLAARVFVNRVWQQYFGRGLVETENDFGTQGAEPTHPELLDWLASEFIARQWSMKALHRLIVTSATYRQASRMRPDLELVDPNNKLLARQSRLRLDAEIIRDSALVSTGLLAPRLGGPPVFPPQPEGVMTVGQVKREWRVSTGEDRFRRALYTHLWRSTPHPAFAVFDAADGFSSCTRRLRSNTPLQALTLLNDEQFYEFAEALAGRVQAEAGPELPDQIDFAFRLCLVRAARPAEKDRLIALYHQQAEQAGSRAADRRRRGWLTLARVLLNLDETITRE